MAINKVIDRNGNTVIDLTTDTVDESKVLFGEKFHGKDGEIYFGKLQYTPAEKIKTIKFIDKYSNLIAEYTLEELMSLEALPEYPEELIQEEVYSFKNWNWTLEELKTLDWEHTYEYPVIGAVYGTNKHVCIRVTRYNSGNFTETFSLKVGGYCHYKYSTTNVSTSNYNNFRGRMITIDWGDGNIEEIEQTTSTGSMTIDHVYSTPGTYVISGNYSDEFMEGIIEFSKTNYSSSHEELPVIGLYNQISSANSSYYGISYLSSDELFDIIDERYILLSNYGSSYYTIGDSAFIVSPISSFNKLTLETSKRCSFSFEYKDLGTFQRFKFISLPRYLDQYSMYSFTDGCAGAGFIPESPSYNFYAYNFYDDDIFYIDRPGSKIYSSNNGSNDYKMYRKIDSCAQAPRKIFFRSANSTSETMVPIFFNGNNGGWNNFDFRYTEEIDFLTKWTTVFYGGQNSTFERLKRFKLAEPLGNMSRSIFQSKTNASGGNQISLGSVPCTIDLTMWTRVPAFTGSTTHDPIFAVNSLTQLKTQEHKVLVRESLLDQFKSTTPWNVISDLYIGVPDAEIVE